MEIKKIATAMVLGATALSMSACHSTPKAAEASTQVEGQQNQCSGKTAKHSCK